MVSRKFLMLDKIKKEYENARTKYPPFNSTHEGYAVILEEVDELWQLVKANKGLSASEEMERECIQIAAMALAFILDLTIIKK